jgi:hypothetical protein
LKTKLPLTPERAGPRLIQYLREGGMERGMRVLFPKPMFKSMPADFPGSSGEELLRKMESTDRFGKLLEKTAFTPKPDKILDDPYLASITLALSESPADHEEHLIELFNRHYDALKGVKK